MKIDDTEMPEMTLRYLPDVETLIAALWKHDGSINIAFLGLAAILASRKYADDLLNDLREIIEMRDEARMPREATASLVLGELIAFQSDSGNGSAGGKTPGVLEPGESVTVPVYYAGMQEPRPSPLQSSPQFDLRILTTSDTDAVDWSSLQSSLQPAGVPNAAGNTIYGNLTSQLGTTWGGYVQALDNEAEYLGQLGENVTDIGKLWGFAVQQADNALNPLASATDDAVAIPGSLSLDFSCIFASTIDGRDTMGPLGMGWSTPWQSSATVGADGTVTITEPAGALRIFQPDSRTSGAYFSSIGDTGTLTADGNGGYLLTEANGIKTDYASNGLLNYMQDTDGNRITAVYSSGRLTSLTTSSGQSLTIGYDVAELISSISDSLGRSTTYAYDSSNTNLLTVTSYTGQVTSYAYDTAASSAQNALTTVTYPGNTHQYFTYDSQGRLASSYQDGGTRTYSYGYSLGQVSVTDILNNTSNLYYNEQGLVTKYVDPLGNVTLGNYDGNLNLTRITNAFDQSESYAYNSAGEVTPWTDFLGNTTNFSYTGPFNELSSMTDAKGNQTQYSYNSSGDLLSVNYADGSSESFTYDPEGNATSFVDPNQQPIKYTYNAAGQVTSATFSDGSTYAYTYDAFGNLLTATDSTGTTTFTYAPTTEFLTEVSYPGGQYLKFQYNAAGQRTQMVDQTGFTTNYFYNSDGWLSQLTDGSGNSIVQYSYCNCGHLMEKINGNGTFTDYTYDADGNLLTLINYAPNGSVNSSFIYTYNSLGLETSEATTQGTWTYSYDADGQLVHAVFASNNPTAVPNQDLVYNYDALGNRTSTVINGLTTTYMTNDMNQYTSVGGVAYKYDANGNLLYDGTNTYSYNSLNQFIDLSGPNGTTTWTYNALGQQVASTTNGVATQHLVDPAGLGNMVGEFAGGALVADYVYGLGLTSQVTPAGAYFYNFDGVGNAVVLTGSDGGESDAYSYLPFSSSLLLLKGTANSFQFNAQFGDRTIINGSVSALATAVGWGDFNLIVPAGSQYYQATVPMTYNGQTFDVDVTAGIHTATGQVYASFLSVDPDTSLLPDVLTGFLPPEDGTGRGMGYVRYIVNPIAGLPTGTQITNVAFIRFDQQVLIATDQVDDEDPTQGTDPTKEAPVTIDSVPPTSSVSSLPASEGSSSFLVQWSGQDDVGGSGTAFYDIYVSDDGGAYTLFQSNTSATSANFSGQPGHSYSFYSVATDKVGNVEPTPASAEATTIVAYAPQFSSLAGPQLLTFGALGLTFSGTIDAGAVTPPAGETVAVTLNGVTQNAIIQADGSFSTTFNIATLPASATPYAITYSYSGDPTFNAVQDAISTTVTIIPATPTINVSDAGGVANGSSYSATATIAGVGADATPNSTLERVGLTLTYYTGTYASLAQLTGLVPLAGAPSAAGDYTVLASFAGSSDYAAVATLANFTITPAAPSLTDVTSQLNISRSGYVYNIKTRTYTQTLTITNTGGALSGPVSLIFGSLGNATLVNASGKTTVTHGSLAAASSYLSLAASLAGQSLTVTLLFSSLPPSYVLSALEGSGTL